MTSTEKIQVAAFYQFRAIANDRVDALARALEKSGEQLGLRGLVILASEGLNATIAGESRKTIESWLSSAEALLGFSQFSPKWSESDVWPFRLFKVRVRSEIVTLGKPEVHPLEPGSETHLSPAQWNKVLESEDCVVLDTRNWYETKIGTFKGAIDPKLNEFSEFSDYLKTSPIAKEQKVLIFCTGGIRCEKAIVEMQSQGFQNVFQLDGGILNYLAQYPNQQFEGECFVFDSRVAVRQDLQPSTTYKLCPHCGQPAQQSFACKRCGGDAFVCESCLEHAHRHTCSKNCAHHALIAPGRRGKGQGPAYRYLATTRRHPRNQTQEIQSQNNQLKCQDD